MTELKEDDIVITSFRHYDKRETRYALQTTTVHTEKEARQLKHKILQALALEKRVRERMIQCRDNTNKLSMKTQWTETVYQDKLEKELQQILGDKA